MINSTTILMKLKTGNTNFSSSETLELKAMQQKYPYFQIGAMVLTKALLKTNDSEYRTSLAKTATIIYDREVLFNYLYNDILTKEEVKQAIKVEPKKTTAVSTPTIEKKTITSPTPTIEKQTKASPIKIKVAEKPEAPKPIKNTKGEEVGNKEQMMKEVVAKLTTTKKEEPATKAKAPKAINKKVEKKKEAKIIKAETIKKEEVKVKAEKTVKKKEAKTTKPISKTKAKQSVKKASSKVINKQIKPIDKSKSIEIMEKFIKEDPSINKPQDKAYTEELKLAKSSVAEEYDIISETIAKLYLAQGNKKKAKKIYEKLSLIYPEKSTYFAARISDL